MAAYTVNHSKSATLVANTADTVTFRSVWSQIEIINRGTDYLYARFDGTAATVAGDDCDVVMPGTAAVFTPPPNAVTVASLISASATAYSATVG